MGSSVRDLAYIYARVRAMISTLLTPQELNEMILAPDYSALLGMLRRTIYGPYLARVDEKDLTPRRAVFEIRNQMADTYSTVIDKSPDSIRPLLKQLYRGFEVDNLKAVLRGITSGSNWDRVRYVLFPLGSQTVLPAKAMVDEGNIAGAIEHLRRTPYYTPLAYALRRYNAEQSLFPLEVALDISYWRDIWKEIHKLSKKDRDQALHIIGSLLDANNLMWAIRYRVYHKLSEEEVINYTLPFGYRVRDTDIRAIAAGDDITQVVSKIYPDLTNVAELLQNPQSGLPELEVEFHRTIRAVCRAAFVGYPFQVGVFLGFLTLKKMEVQDLTALIEAKSSQISADGLRPFLLTQSSAK
jgi:V/A-type H+/Na+-transporting ATPase subunit C